MLARGLEMPEAVRGLAHADAAVASSFLPGMGRRIPYRINRNESPAFSRRPVRRDARMG